jgi:Nucleotidyltransferase domain
VDDDAFPRYVAGRLGELPGVTAVTLGGSRAQGTQRPDSDWDFSVYYRGHFDPQALRDTGWPGEVFEVGGWGGGVFNGGAWLEVDGRRTDVHYRDLNVIDRELAASREGRFAIEPLMFHLAGIPTYLVLAELAVKRVLHGELPARGQWVTNEKTLLTRAGLREVDELFAAGRSAPDALLDLVDRARDLCSAALREATGS